MELRKRLQRLEELASHAIGAGDGAHQEAANAVDAELLAAFTAFKTYHLAGNTVTPLSDRLNDVQYRTLATTWRDHWVRVHGRTGERSR